MPTSATAKVAVATLSHVTVGERVRMTAASTSSPEASSSLSSSSSFPMSRAVCIRLRGSFARQRCTSLEISLGSSGRAFRTGAGSSLVMEDRTAAEVSPWKGRLPVSIS